MKRVFRPLFGLLLALVLTVTAQSMAVARTSASPTGELVLCTGTGPVTIQVDAEGNPTGPAHICPDCAMSLFQMEFSAPDVVRDTVWTGLSLRPESQTDQLFLSETRATARAPPVVI